MPSLTMARMFLVVTTLCALVPSGAVKTSTAAQFRVRGNPIRKVVTLLQDLQKETEEEGDKEKALFEKYMCYCKDTTASLTKSSSDSTAKVSELEASIEEQSALKSQLEQDIVSHRSDRDAAVKAVKESTAMREKEAAEYGETSGEMKSNVQAMGGALEALKKGLSSELLQTSVGSTIRAIIDRSPAIDDVQRDQINEFLQSGGQSGAEGSDQIIGVISQMMEDMQAGLKEAEQSETEGIASFEALSGAKAKEIGAATRALEEKTSRVGEVAVSIVQNKADLGNTGASKEEDDKMLAELTKSCASKTTEHEERSKLRADEIQAVSETIKILNDDDALELFKKTLPAPDAAPGVFLQTASMTRSQQRRMMTSVRAMMKRDPGHSANYRLMLYAMKGKHKGGFEKVTEMIENMVTLLKKEDVTDAKQKDFCVAEIDKTEDQKKDLGSTIADLDAQVAEKEDGAKAMQAEIEAVQQGIGALDQSVALATEQRKAEHSEYTTTAAANSAAKDLLGMAKNRMNKFYNPKAAFIQAPAPTDSLFVQQNLMARDAPQEQESSSSALAGIFLQVSSRSGGGGGVVALISQLVHDVELDMQEAKKNEENSQKDYEEAMVEASEKRAADSKLIVTREEEKAQITSVLEDVKTTQGSKSELLATAAEKLRDLHLSCDNLLANFDARKKARTAEIEGLTQAKATLGGANFGFLQRR